MHCDNFHVKDIFDISEMLTGIPLTIFISISGISNLIRVPILDTSLDFSRGIFFLSRIIAIFSSFVSSRCINLDKLSFEGSIFRSEITHAFTIQQTFSSLLIYSQCFYNEFMYSIVSRFV